MTSPVVAANVSRTAAEVVFTEDDSSCCDCDFDRLADGNGDGDGNGVGNGNDAVKGPRVNC